MYKKQTGEVIPFSSKSKEHECSCGGNCGQEHSNGELHHCKCAGPVEVHGESHECSCGHGHKHNHTHKHTHKHTHLAAPSADRVSIHLETRSAEHCGYILTIDDQRAIIVNLEKLSDKIVVTLKPGEDAPDAVKAQFKPDVRTYENMNAQQYVEFYNEGEDLIPEDKARLFAGALRSGVLEQDIERILLEDGWIQRQIEFDGKYYSIVTHPNFDPKQGFGYSCEDADGYYLMAGITAVA